MISMVDIRNGIHPYTNSASFTSPDQEGSHVTQVYVGKAVKL